LFIQDVELVNKNRSKADDINKENDIERVYAEER